jgi:hypothetical protein
MFGPTVRSGTSSVTGGTMPEILTESFCERCGTRYTFESSAPRSGPLRGIKVFGQGLKNFVLSDDTSMDEALAAARSDAERRATTQQLDAFHKTFNFCMTCRQYTCGNCWNEAEARCLTCAPHLGREIMPAPFPTLEPAAGTAPLDSPIAGYAAAPTPFESAPAAWPMADGLPSGADEFEGDGFDAGPGETEAPEEIDLAARLRSLELGETEAPVEVEEAAAWAETPVVVEEAAAWAETPVVVEEAAPAAEFEPAIEPAPAIEPEPAIEFEPTVRTEAPLETAADEPGHGTPVEPEPAVWAEPAVAAQADAPFAAEPEQPDEPVLRPAATLDERTAAARDQTASLLARFRPGQSLDDALDAFERDQAAGAPESEDQPALEPADMADEHVAEPPALEPITAEPVPAATAAEPEAPAPEPQAADDHVEQPTWPLVAPETPGPAPAPPAQQEQPALPAAASAAPEWPAQPQWPAAPQWPSQPAWPGSTPSRPSDGTILGRPMVPSGGIDALWAASSGEVLGQSLTGPAQNLPQAAPLGVQPCVNCGLSLSATARFCRRCGSPQAHA